MADDLLSLLEGMGETADEIADFLRGQGCQGELGVTSHCPVAVYLARHLSQRLRVSVRHGHTIYWDPPMPGLEKEVLNPPPVSEFIHNFDTGLYPDLIRAVKT